MNRDMHFPNVFSRKNLLPWLLGVLSVDSPQLPTFRDCLAAELSYRRSHHCQSQLSSDCWRQEWNCPAFWTDCSLKWLMWTSHKHTSACLEALRGPYDNHDSSCDRRMLERATFIFRAPCGRAELPGLCYHSSSSSVHSVLLPPSQKWSFLGLSLDNICTFNIISRVGFLEIQTCDKWWQPDGSPAGTKDRITRGR